MLNWSWCAPIGNTANSKSNANYICDRHGTFEVLIARGSACLHRGALSIEVAIRINPTCLDVHLPSTSCLLGLEWNRRPRRLHDTNAYVKPSVRRRPGLQGQVGADCPPKLLANTLSWTDLIIFTAAANIPAGQKRSRRLFYTFVFQSSRVSPRDTVEIQCFGHPDQLYTCISSHFQIWYHVSSLKLYSRAE